ncbi:MAG: UDP-N-acetylglucosamine--N-acetylmuramyl-(pentapeptide) pyrophosphoryl-undecaprenol N-acetylglucosamine transferase [Candidatus Limnocylindrales bacterium]
MRLLIAGGGTGGHIYPALAVARSLRAPTPAVEDAAGGDVPELLWVGGHRGLEGSVVRAAGIPFSRLVLRSLRSVERDANLVLDPVRLGASVPQATAILARYRPAAIFTTGGYVAIPILMAAAALRIPVVLWEGNVVPGRSVRATARLAGVFAVSFTATCRALPTSAPCFRTGTPIRDLASIDRAAARLHFGVPADAGLLLVFGGSQAVRRFNAAVAEALPALVERRHVIHVTGDEGYAAALAGREDLPAALRERYRPFPFLRDDMGLALAAADLVVGRAGSSTLAEVTALGVPMVVVPYPHAAGHQLANARVLADAGAARLIHDEAFDPAALLTASALIDDRATYSRMAAAAKSLGRPGAAAAVAALVRAVAEGRQLPDGDAIERLARGAA